MDDLEASTPNYKQLKMSLGLPLPSYTEESSTTSPLTDESQVRIFPSVR